MSHWMPYSKNRFTRGMKRQMLRWFPGMITCEEFEKFIVDYLEDNLSVSKKHTFERHLKICPECIDYLDAYSKVRDVSSASVIMTSQHINSEVPDDLVKAVVDAMSSDDEN